MVVSMQQAPAARMDSDHASHKLVLLTFRFKHVVAIEPNAKQLQHAVQAENIIYREGSAEASGMPDASVDLVASAQACHW